MGARMGAGAGEAEGVFLGAGKRVKKENNLYCLHCRPEAKVLLHSSLSSSVNMFSLKKWNISWSVNITNLTTYTLASETR